MVEYDSIIPPGRAGTITPEVDISKMHGGEVHKSVSVISNAENEPTLRLTLAATIKALIDVKTRYIRLKAGEDDGASINVMLETEKSDLKVNGVSFESHSSGSSGPMWQAQLPVTITHKLSRADKPKKDGYYEYTLQISLVQPPAETRHGEFIIQTNHSRKAELKLRGMIEVPTDK